LIIGAMKDKQLFKEMEMGDKQTKDPAKTGEDLASVERASKDGPLADQDLATVAGGAACNGPGTQTEDDLFVG
jgi:hypothetical protein